MVASAITKGAVAIENVILENLETLMITLKRTNMRISISKEGIYIENMDTLKPLNITTAPYLGFPTYMQPVLTALLSTATGTSTVTETVFKQRFSYVTELKKMGADIEVSARARIKMFLVAITGVGGAAGITTIKALKTPKAKIKLIGFDADPLSAGFKLVNRGYLIPKATSKDFVRVLLQKCVDEKIELLIPTVDEELFDLAQHRDEFMQAGIKVAVSSPETIKTTRDKWLTFKHLTRADIPTPKTWLPHCFNYNFFPVVVKPRMGRGGRDIYLCENKQEASFAVKKVKKPIIQELLVAQEYTVDTFSDADRVARIAVPRRTVMRKCGLMWRGVTERNMIIENTCKKAAESLNIVGPGCFQGFFYKGKFKIFEAHNRIGGTTSLSVASGVNIPLMTLQLFLYGRADIPTSFRKVSVSRYTEEVFF